MICNVAMTTLLFTLQLQCCCVIALACLVVGFADVIQLLPAFEIQVSHRQFVVHIFGFVVYIKATSKRCSKDKSFADSWSRMVADGRCQHFAMLAYENGLMLRITLCLQRQSRLRAIGPRWPFH